MTYSANADATDNRDHTLIPLYEQIHQITNSLLIPSQEITANDLQSLIILAEKYFLTHQQYEQSIYQKMQRDYILHRYRGYVVYDEPQPTVEKALLKVLQKYFYESPSFSQNLEDIIKLRDILRQVQIMDHGHLSGRVWLHHSSLPIFARRYLPQIDEKIIQTSLNDAAALRKKHQYSNAQKIYKELLQDYNDTPYAAPIKVLLDAAIVEDYYNRAELAFAKHNYKKGRAAYRKIIELYPDSDAAKIAQKAMDATVPVAVRYFKEQGDANYHAKNHPYVPQTKAREFYEKMYNEDPDGPQADYALYHWARALGTENKVREAMKLLGDFDTRFPRSKIRDQAMFLRGFYNGGQTMNDPASGAVLMDQMARLYPESPDAPQALWYGAFYNARSDQFDKAVADLELLQKTYPQDKHLKHLPQWLPYFRNKLQTGGKWP